MANLDETRAWASTFFADLRFNGKNGTLPYRLHLPGRYEHGKTYPLVLLMHGYGSIGSNNWGQLFLCGLFANNPNVDLDNVFILAPQCPADGTWIKIADDNKWLGVDYTCRAVRRCSPQRFRFAVAAIPRRQPPSPRRQFGRSMAMPTRQFCLKRRAGWFVR